jgi:hypothetical protein
MTPFSNKQHDKRCDRNKLPSSVHLMSGLGSMTVHDEKQVATFWSALQAIHVDTRNKSRERLGHMQRIFNVHETKCEPMWGIAVDQIPPNFVPHGGRHARERTGRHVLAVWIEPVVAALDETERGINLWDLTRIRASDTSVGSRPL